jgi:hypothetical protein
MNFRSRKLEEDNLENPAVFYAILKTETSI